MNHFNKYYEDLAACIRSIGGESKLYEQAISLIENVKNNGRKVIIVGNGGSASIASHVSVDFVKAAGIRAINFNEPNLITCFSNDYGYEHWVAEALSAYADAGDLVMLISSSGKSMNIINAATTARKMDLSIITFSGFKHDNSLRKMGDVNFWADSSTYNVIEMTHHVWLLALVEKFAIQK